MKLPPDRPLILVSQLLLLARIPQITLLLQFLHFLVLLEALAAVIIWGYRQLWDEAKSQYLIISRKEFGRNVNLGVLDLSRASKEVLIKSVAQAIPSYCMGAFLIPTSLCEEIKMMMNSFYWGSKKNGQRGINWMRWDKVTLHKSNGSLGFRNMEAFNLSMLGKQGLKLLTEPSSLLTRILKAKYFPRWDFLDANIGHNPSYTWRSIWSSQSLITLGYRWKIGDGSKINVWSMPWIRSLPSLKPSTSPPPHMEDLTVRVLLSSDLSTWDANVVNSVFSFADAAAILNIPLRHRAHDDIRVWQHTIDGSYSVKSAYNSCIALAAETNNV